MSQKGRLRRLERGVEWLETEGRFRRIELMIKLLEMKQQIADRLATDPAAAARWKKDFPDFPCKLPPPSPHLRQRAPEPDVRPPPPKVESPPPPPPPPPPKAEVSPPASPPALPGQPVAPPQPDMEIRPVRWRPRGERDDDEEERPGTNGRCITEYDPLRDEDDDDDDG